MLNVRVGIGIHEIRHIQIPACRNVVEILSQNSSPMSLFAFFVLVALSFVQSAHSVSFGADSDVVAIRAEWRRVLDLVAAEKRAEFVSFIRPLLSEHALANLPNSESGHEFKRILVVAPQLNPPAKFAYVSQCGQDYIVDRLFKQTNRPLFYLDLAANDAQKISNTFVLDRFRGWGGICIEANPIYWAGLAAERSCTTFGLAVAAPGVRTVTFNFRDDEPVLASIAGFDNKQMVGKPIGAASLLSILHAANAPSTIDYLSLDVEGAEFYIMQHFPFSQYRFNVLTVERPGYQLSALLESQNYVKIGATAVFDDELWFHREFLAEVQREMGVANVTVASLRQGYTGNQCL